MYREYTINVSLWYLVKLLFVGIRDFFKLIAYICFILLPDLLINWWVEGAILSEYIEDYKADIKDAHLRRRWGTFVVGISENEIFTNEGDFQIHDITSYHPSLGNSEPYVILTNGSRIVIETSWLKKTERLKVDTALQKLINGKRT